MNRNRSKELELNADIDFLFKIPQKDDHPTAKKFQIQDYTSRKDRVLEQAPLKLPSTNISLRNDFAQNQDANEFKGRNPYHGFLEKCKFNSHRNSIYRNTQNMTDSIENHNSTEQLIHDSSKSRNQNRKKSRQVEFVAGTVGYLSSSSSKNTLFDSKSKRMIKDNEMRHIKYHEGIEKSQNSTHSQSKIKIIIQSEDSTAKTKPSQMLTDLSNNSKQNRKLKLTERGIK